MLRHFLTAWRQLVVMAGQRLNAVPPTATNENVFTDRKDNKLFCSSPYSLYLDKRRLYRPLKKKTTHRCFPRLRFSSLCGRSCCPGCPQHGSLSSVASPYSEDDSVLYLINRLLICLRASVFCWLVVFCGTTTALWARDGSELKSPRV